MFTILFYLSAMLLMAWSFHKDREKTLIVLKKSWRSFENILPLFLALLCGLGILLSVLTPMNIAWLLGGQSGIRGLILSAIIGSCTIIPGFVTFPLARTLLENGAGTLQIILFISCSVMVGILSLPIEIQYFGKRTACIRNSLALFFSFIIAFVMEAILL